MTGRVQSIFCQYATNMCAPATESIALWRQFFEALGLQAFRNRVLVAVCALEVRRNCCLNLSRDLEMQDGERGSRRQRQIWDSVMCGKKF